MDTQKWSIGFISLAFLFITSSSAELLIKQRNRIQQFSQFTNGVTRVWRDDRPSDKILSITSFSIIRTRPEPYESSVFEAVGYKWRLVLYVNGNEKDGGKDHVSLYAKIVETESLPVGWEVNVDLKLFVYNGKLNKYLIVTDGTVKRYNNATKELGYGQLIPQSTFYDGNDGYREQDTGTFGAEIYIVKPAQQKEKVTFISNPPDNVFTWKILHFSTLEDKVYQSNEFLVGDRYWKLGLNPKGGLVPIFLYAQGFKANAVVTTTYAATNLRLKNQRSSNHVTTYTAYWYLIPSGLGLGVNTIPLSDVKDASKGYVVNDSIIIEVEMLTVSVTNIVSA
ncbi:TRAF-like family protein [Arabidopsis thaliana]|uniref:TRAF-like family protein n=1 Tax=Arabidopsis thaliana TaxID=3702 RepID=F4JZS4_ARATH|nr:TRAF-like family protein [Arabidopsis thaliana]AED93548.2 TRAF-like family protein [Arabidopsis thaliana]|eukprot:NP_001318656.1 TRAF-like family protein [Arabidopsis thaliana]